MKTLKELREKNKITQNKLAGILGVSRSAVSMWEIDSSEPDTDTINKLADYFQVSTDYLLGRTEITRAITPPPPPAEVTLDEIEFALSGVVRELDEEDKLELLRDAQRMKELMDLRKKQGEQNTGKGSEEQ